MSPEKEGKVFMVIFATFTVIFLVLSAGFLYFFVMDAPIVNISDMVVTLVLATASAAAFCLSWTSSKDLKKQKKRGG